VKRSKPSNVKSEFMASPTAEQNRRKPESTRETIAKPPVHTAQLDSHNHFNRSEPFTEAKRLYLRVGDE